MTREEEVREYITKRIKAKDEGVKSIIRESAVLGMTWADEHPKNPWVSVKERLPKRSKSKYDYENRFLVCREGGSPFVAIYHKNCKWYILDYMQYTEIVAPDYWMPMPIPKGGEK